MDRTISGVVLAHYLYLPVDDQQISQAVWNELSQRYAVSELTVTYIVSELLAYADDFPLIKRDDRVALGFSIAGNIIAIELFYLADSWSLAEAHAELDRVRLMLSGNLHYVVGETSVAVSRPSSAPGDADQTPFAAPALYQAEVRGGVLSYLGSQDDTRRYYRIDEAHDEALGDILSAGLPEMDMLVFKLFRQTDYFRDQRSSVNTKKSEIDKEISDILHQWMGIKSSSESKNIDLLEHDIEKLSLVYGELAGSLRLIKNAHDTLARNIDRLESLLEEMGARQESMEEFKGSLLTDGYALLRQLEFDDELLHRSLDDTRATIEVVRTRIELERSRESFLLQKEGVSVQTAAGLIELVVVGFYTLETWELLAGLEKFEHIPASIRLGLDAAFAITVVAFTHYIAKYLRKENPNPGMVLAGMGIVLSLVLMVVATNFSHWG